MDGGLRGEATLMTSSSGVGTGIARVVAREGVHLAIISRIPDAAPLDEVASGTARWRKLAGGNHVMLAPAYAEETAYTEIKQRILEGRLPPGARLVHRVLAKELGMSPSPLVLALRMLERDGLVVNTPGLGACVRVWTQQEITDSHHIRAFHEALAARLCAERATAADLAAIVAAHEAIRRSIDAVDAEANIRAELDFHVAIVRGAHCPDLERMSENLSIVHRSMTAFAISLKVPRLLTPEMRDIHQPIVEAITRRDAEAAEKAARKHVEDSLARNLALIEKVAAAMVTDASSRSLWRGGRSATAGTSGAAARD